MTSRVTPAPVAAVGTGALVLVGVVVGLALPVVGGVALVPVGLVLVIALCVVDRGVPLYLAVLTGCTALPTDLVGTVQIGPVAVFTFEPFLYAGLALVLLAPARARLPRPLLALAGVVVLGGLGGVLASHAIVPIAAEVRPMLIFLASTLIVPLIAGTRVARRLVITIAVSLWISLPMTLLGSIGAIELGGREESALTGGAAASGEAVRLLTPATTTALAVIVVGLTLAACERARFLRILPWLLPSVPIVVLSFTRSQILTLGVATLFVLLTVRAWSMVGRLLRLGALIVAGAVAAGLLLTVSPAGSWFSVQLAGITGRTLEVGTAESVSDPSAVWREQESRDALRAIGDAPLFGGGFGAAYRLPQGEAGTFYGDQAPYFNHDLYLWLPLKVGLLGLAVYVVAAGLPLLRILRAGRSASASAVAAGAAGAGWCALDALTPQPIGYTSAIVAGAIIGGCWALAPTGYARRREPVTSRETTLVSAGAG